ncbi:MAG: hypothetical protein QOF65_1161 [Thermoleophilaceae bacterium]|jgi:hypothetical protein|nr:hypothetical protein [Thermoleophilaceae bacterium]MEA2436605.1 hypothetical protein [Thermoleophilaceae bacterium]
MEPATAPAAAETSEAYCPHCFLLVESDARGSWPPQPTRCQHCKLMIGPGRARATSDAAPGARGTAAGVFAQAAREGRAEADDVSPDRVRDAIRTVAERTGARPERLLMVDYQQRAAKDTSLPSLREVFAAFGSWKRARRESAGTT